MMTTVYDFIIKEYIYFDRIKRFRTSLKLTVNIETVNVTNSINATKFTCLVFSINSVSPTNSVLSTYSVPSINTVFSTNSVLSTTSVFFTTFTNKS